MGLFDFLKGKKPSMTHEEKMDKAYEMMNPDYVKQIFPGGKDQADRAVRSLAEIYHMDPETCGVDDYRAILKSYVSLWTRVRLAGMEDEEVINFLQTECSGLVKDEATARAALEYFVNNLEEPTPSPE